MNLLYRSDKARSQSLEVNVHSFVRIVVLLPFVYISVSAFCDFITLMEIYLYKRLEFEHEKSPRLVHYRGNVGKYAETVFFNLIWKSAGCDGKCASFSKKGDD